MEGNINESTRNGAKSFCNPLVYDWRLSLLSLSPHANPPPSHTDFRICLSENQKKKKKKETAFVFRFSKKKNEMVSVFRFSQK